MAADSTDPRPIGGAPVGCGSADSWQAIVTCRDCSGVGREPRLGDALEAATGTGRAGGLYRRSAPGRASSLTATQWRHLFQILGRGAQAAGFETGRWTQRLIAAVIQQEFGVQYHFRSLSRGLRAWDWSPQ
jgi:hypothetical protein